ncbi:glycosyltransferase [Dactylosporangium sp. NPDC049525]|uniref:glycosyltransferase n=1 Tax=Dactylosporangium sp. NPDC049525 TaxID=3154730 RepID=UPI003446E3EC
MRIAMVHSSFALLGGAEQYVRDLSRDLEARGHEVRVFARASANAQPGDGVLSTRVSARVPRARKLFTHLGDVFDPTGAGPADLRDFAPDVVHVHNWQGIGALPVAALARAHAVVHTVHDYAIADPNNALANRGRSGPLDRLLDLRSAWLVRRLRRVTTLWPAARTRDLLAAHVPGARRLPGRVVPLAVPESMGSDWPPGRRDVLLFMGALSPHKGIEVLLEAWRAVGPEVGATLLVAGDGPARAAVEAAAAADPTLRYLGFLDAAGKAAALAEAGWLVFPSQWVENFPISCVEALRAGRPIISSAIARPPMASAGSVVEFTDTATLAGAVRQAVLSTDAQYAAFAASAADDGVRLDWPAHVDAVLEAYHAVAGARTGRPGTLREHG